MFLGYIAGGAASAYYVSLLVEEEGNSRLKLSSTINTVRRRNSHALVEITLYFYAGIQLCISSYVRSSLGILPGVWEQKACSWYY